MMTAYEHGFDDGLAGREAQAQRMPKEGRRSYKMGYRHGTDEREIAEARTTRTTEIVLQINTASYLMHYYEQEGELPDLANLLKHDALKALAEIDLIDFCRQMVIDDQAGKNGTRLMVPVQDNYIHLLSQETDDEEITEPAPLA